MITIASTVSVKPDLIFSEMEGEFIMLDAASGKYFHLDSMGSEIFREVREPRRVADLCASLAIRFEAERNQIETDTIAFLTQMSAKGLIEVSI